MRAKHMTKCEHEKKAKTRTKPEMKTKEVNEVIKGEYERPGRKMPEMFR